MKKNFYLILILSIFNFSSFVFGSLVDDEVLHTQKKQKIMETTSINYLPDTLINKIISYLEKEDVRNACSISKIWRNQREKRFISLSISKFTEEDKKFFNQLNYSTMSICIPHFETWKSGKSWKSCRNLCQALESDKEISDLILYIKNTGVYTVNNDYPQTAQFTLAFNIAHVLMINNTLKALSLIDIEFSSEHINMLAESLYTNKTLTELRLKDEVLDPKGLNFLLMALMENKKIKTLKMETKDSDDNHHESKKNLAELLKVNNSIEYLSVKGWIFSEDQFNLLTNSLCSNSTLTYLDCSDSIHSDEIAKKLATVIKSNKTLREIDFSENSITDIGARALCEAMLENYNLQKLNLESIDNEYYGVSKLFKVEFEKKLSGRIRF